MPKTLRRASILLSVLVLATMLTSTDFVSQSPGFGGGPDLAKRGEAVLQALDFRFSEGLAQLTIKTGPDDAYTVRMDVAEAVAGLREPANYRLALMLIGIWVFSPALYSLLKPSRSTEPPGGPAHSEPPRESPATKSRYHHVHGLTTAQLARGLQGLGKIGATLKTIRTRSVIRNTRARSTRAKKYTARHAMAGRRR